MGAVATSACNSSPSDFRPGSVSGVCRRPKALGLWAGSGVAGGAEGAPVAVVGGTSVPLAVGKGVESGANVPLAVGVGVVSVVVAVGAPVGMIDGSNDVGVTETVPVGLVVGNGVSVVVAIGVPVGMADGSVDVGVTETVPVGLVVGNGVSVVPVGMTDGSVNVGATETVPVGLVVGNRVSVVVAVGVPVGTTDESVGVGVTEPVSVAEVAGTGVEVEASVHTVAVGVAALSVHEVVSEQLITRSLVPRASANAIASAGLSNVIILVVTTVDTLTVVAGSGSRFS